LLAEVDWEIEPRGSFGIHELDPSDRIQEVAESLDVGAGSGVFSRVILDAGISRSALCVDPGYKKEYTETHQGKDMPFTRSIGKVSKKLILMMDVLEHVDDDVGLLREYTENMPDDGLVVISVPAFQFLWSGHGVFLEHRYTRRTIGKIEYRPLYLVHVLGQPSCRFPGGSGGRMSFDSRTLESAIKQLPELSEYIRLVDFIWSNAVSILHLKHFPNIVES
jgi:hypothetical protein